MSILNDYNEKREEYLGIKGNLSENIVDFSDIGTTWTSKIEELKNKESEINKFSDVKREYDALTAKIVNLSTVFIKELDSLIKVFETRSHEGILEYDLRETLIGDSFYMVLYPKGSALEEINEDAIILGKTNGLTVSFYSLSEDKESLEGIDTYNFDSVTLDYLKQFIDTYIEYRNSKRVSSLEEFSECFYKEGELSIYPEDIIEDYSNQQEKQRIRDKRKKTKTKKRHREYLKALKYDKQLSSNRVLEEFINLVNQYMSDCNIKKLDKDTLERLQKEYFNRRKQGYVKKLKIKE